MSEAQGATDQVFPAYAGVIRTFGTLWLMHGGIPRVCGGEPSGYSQNSGVASYSPRMRGCSAERSGERWRSEVFPAHAGVFRDSLQCKKDGFCIPRACGGVFIFYKFTKTTKNNCVPFSPYKEKKPSGCT